MNRRTLAIGCVWLALHASLAHAQTSRPTGAWGERVFQRELPDGRKLAVDERFAVDPATGQPLKHMLTYVWRVVGDDPAKDRVLFERLGDFSFASGVGPKPAPIKVLAADLVGDRLVTAFNQNPPFKGLGNRCWAYVVDPDAAKNPPAFDYRKPPNDRGVSEEGCLDEAMRDVKIEALKGGGVRLLATTEQGAQQTYELVTWNAQSGATVTRVPYWRRADDATSRPAMGTLDEPNEIGFPDVRFGEASLPKVAITLFATAKPLKPRDEPMVQEDGTDLEEFIVRLANAGDGPLDVMCEIDSFEFEWPADGPLNVKGLDRRGWSEPAVQLVAVPQGEFVPFGRSVTPQTTIREAKVIPGGEATVPFAVPRQALSMFDAVLIHAELILPDGRVAGRSNTVRLDRAK